MTTNSPSFIRHQSLEATQVIPLFDSTSTTFTSIPPFKPKAGEVYVLKLDIGHESKFLFRRIPFLIRYIKSGIICNSMEGKHRYITDWRLKRKPGLD
jgi:hypothetical protein